MEEGPSPGVLHEAIAYLPCVIGLPIPIEGIYGFCYRLEVFHLQMRIPLLYVEHFLMAPGQVFSHEYRRKPQGKKIGVDAMTEDMGRDALACRIKDSYHAVDIIEA